MAASGIITFTTDFGHRSSYVGQMKGAALAVDPGLRLVDLCHEVPPHRVGTGAFILETGYAAFPPGTVHVAVVDPGVGTARRALAVRAGAHFFVAPDNGLLTRVLEREELTDSRLILPASGEGASVSATFEGRDLFAPAAARIARGLALSEIGPPAGEPLRLELRRPALERASVEAVTVLHVDDFGNVIFDIRGDLVRSALGIEECSESGIAIETAAGMVESFRRTYEEAPAGEPFMLINSAGYLEIAVRDGSASALLGLDVGMEALLRVGS